LLETGADVAILTFDPSRPRAFQFLSGQCVERRRKVAGQLGQNRPGLVEADESRRSDSRRSACPYQQEDADNPKVRSRNGAILPRHAVGTLSAKK
jgi:hypothetical protein